MGEAGSFACHTLWVWHGSPHCPTVRHRDAGDEGARGAADALAVPPQGRGHTGPASHRLPNPASTTGDTASNQPGERKIALKVYFSHNCCTPNSATGSQPETQRSTQLRRGPGLWGL